MDNSKAEKRVLDAPFEKFIIPPPPEIHYYIFNRPSPKELPMTGMGAVIALASVYDLMEASRHMDHAGRHKVPPLLVSPKVAPEFIERGLGKRGSPVRRNERCPCGSGKKFKVCGRFGKCVKSVASESEVDSSRE